MTFLNIALAAYFLAGIAFVTNAVFGKRAFGLIAIIALSIGCLSNIAAVVLRYYQSGHPPLASMHESLVVVAGSIALFSIIALFRIRAPWLGALCALLAALTICAATMTDSTMRPLIPALKSNWLVVHVTSYLFGYGAAAVAFVSSLLYLLVSRWRPSSDPFVRSLDDLAYRLIAVAFPFLTIGLTTGAIWANVAWGRYWGWDPKETWSLIAWLLYAIYLHARISRGWRGGRAAVLSTAAFGAILFTLFGVNALMGGMHSYGRGA